MSGDTPAGVPSGRRPLTRRKLLRLIAARSTPRGASAATAAGVGTSREMAAILGTGTTDAMPERLLGDATAPGRARPGTGSWYGARRGDRRDGPIMTDMLELGGPVEILVTLGLTLPSITDAQVDAIRLAAPPGSTVRVAQTVRAAVGMATDAEVILGFIPKPLFDAAPKLRWVH